MSLVWKHGWIVLVMAAILLSKANAQTNSPFVDEPSEAPAFEAPAFKAYATDLDNTMNISRSPRSLSFHSSSIARHGNTGGGGLFGCAEGLAWRARRQGLDHTAFLDPVWLTPVQEQSLEYDRNLGFRVGVGYQFETSWDLSWNYTYYQTSDSASVQATDYPALAMVATRSYLDHVIDTMEARTSLNYQVHDIMASRAVRFNPTMSLRFFGGFRWAMIDQHLDQEYTYRDLLNQTVAGTIANPTSLDAYGFRIGTKASWGREWGPAFFVQASGSVLAGNFKTTQREIDAVDGTIIDFSTSSLRPVPILETAMGMAWRNDRMEIAAGYELNAWFNMAQVDRASQDLLLDGVFLRLSLTR